MADSIGTFCAAELHTPDPDASLRFYRELFGWELAPIVHHTDGPARWIPFVQVERLEPAADRARSLGARSVSPPVSRNAVRTCVVEDDGGAVFGLREAQGQGGDVGPEMWWVEISVNDIAAAHRFYTSLFGWRVETTKKYHDPDGHFEYTVFRIGDAGVAGGLQFEPSWGIEQRWQIDFAIDDWERTITQDTQAGCRLEFWRDVPNVGRIGNLWDPNGALFSVMRENAKTG